MVRGYRGPGPPISGRLVGRVDVHQVVRIDVRQPHHVARVEPVEQHSERPFPGCEQVAALARSQPRSSARRRAGARRRRRRGRRWSRPATPRPVPRARTRTGGRTRAARPVRSPGTVSAPATSAASGPDPGGSSRATGSVGVAGSDLEHRVADPRRARPRCDRRAARRRARASPWARPCGGSHPPVSRSPGIAIAGVSGRAPAGAGTRRPPTPGPAGRAGPRGGRRCRRRGGGG